MSENVQTPEAMNERLYQFDNVYAALPSPEAITAERVPEYWAQGFLAAEGLLSSEDIGRATAALMRIIEDRGTKAQVQFVQPQASLRSPEEREFAVRKVSAYVGVDETLRAIAFHPRLLGIVERLVGEPVKLVQDMALLKPPTGGGEKPWHQDMAYGPLAFDKPVIGVWIALDEAALDNGCMHVIPHSHRDGGTPHYAVRDWQICDASVPVERDVAVPLQPGGALFFHGLLHHGTPNNLSAKRRRALQFHYAPASASKLTPREYKRMFTNEMTKAEC